MSKVTVLWVFLFSMFLSLMGTAFQERDQDREIAEANNWIYDDLSRGIDEAQKTGKPLLVVIRCLSSRNNRSAAISVQISLNRSGIPSDCRDSK